MSVTTKVEYSEQAKAVVCKAYVICDDGTMTDEEVRLRAEKLFNNAFEFSKLKTMEKLK